MNRFGENRRKQFRAHAARFTSRSFRNFPIRRFP